MSKARAKRDKREPSQTKKKNPSSVVHLTRCAFSFEERLFHKSFTHTRKHTHPKKRDTHVMIATRSG